ncbi:MAG TPA: hypothetical protein VIH52_02390 [Candidatus Nanoarchaeia archaeon]
MSKIFLGLAVLLLTATACFGAEAEKSTGSTETTPGVSEVLSSGPTEVPTTQPTAVVPPTATAVTNRQNCNQIRGTAYLSEEERSWFQANCVAAQPTSPPPTRQQPASPTQGSNQRNCSPWPQEVESMLGNLRVVDSLCLIIGSPNDGFTQYLASNRTIYMRNVPPIGGFLLGLAHEICHAHQHQIILDAGLPVTNDLQSWNNTPEGQDYIQSTGWRFENGKWVEPQEVWSNGYPGPWEKAAQACAMWYDPGHTWDTDNLKRSGGAIYDWVVKWLPK